MQCLVHYRLIIASRMSLYQVLVERSCSILKLTSAVVDAANHVFLLEPCLDSAILQQAVGRAHRMGQTRPVHVTRLIMHPTVEVPPYTINHPQNFAVNSASCQREQRLSQKSIQHHCQHHKCSFGCIAIDIARLAAPNFRQYQGMLYHTLYSDSPCCTDRVLHVKSRSDSDCAQPVSPS